MSIFAPTTAQLALSSVILSDLGYVKPKTQAQIQSRLEDIVGWLNAYRQGWVVYDAAHVKELQAERAALAKVSA